MRLDQFIESTLSEIAIGVAKAKVRSSKFVAIAPAKINDQRFHTETLVSFDVSLRVASNTESGLSGTAKGSGKMRVVVVDADIGIDGQTSRKSAANEEATHRVAFNVPMVLTAHHRNDPNMKDEADVIRSIDPDWSL